jgi:hypothetical protein
MTEDIRDGVNYDPLFPPMIDVLGECTINNQRMVTVVAKTVLKARASDSIHGSLLAFGFAQKSWIT